MNKLILLLIVIIMIIFLIYKPKKQIERAAFLLDTLRIPNNPVSINEADSRKFIRLIGIEKHLKMDKYDNVEKITYSKPKPELGEKYCFRVKCPAWFSEVVCWKCA